MIERIGGGKVRRRQIVIAVRHKNFQMRIDVQRAAQRFGDVHIAIRMLVETPLLIHLERQNLVRQIAFKFQFAADVIIERGGVGSGDVGITRVVFNDRAVLVVVNPRKARIQTPDGAPLRAQQFFGKVQNLDAQIRAFDIGGRQTRIAREFFDNLRAFRRRQRVALQ
ncbi:MAG: hypothetical protein HDKAJFGB_02110 [Anaerolineae bacterium]|nr:hypothetical protein [Anaerolineae bacterium]